MPSGKGALGGAASGAAAGSVFGPYGTAIGGGLGALIGMFGSGGGEKPMSPELARMYALEQQRVDQANPLVEAAMRLAFQRLPTASRAGMTEPSLASAGEGLPPVMGGDYNEPVAVRNALRSQELRMRMSSPIIEAIQRLAMSRQPRSVQRLPRPFVGGGTGRDDIPEGERGPQGPGRRV